MTPKTTRRGWNVVILMSKNSRLLDLLLDEIYGPLSAQSACPQKYLLPPSLNIIRFGPTQGISRQVYAQLAYCLYYPIDEPADGWPLPFMLVARDKQGLPANRLSTSISVCVVGKSSIMGHEDLLPGFLKYNFPRIHRFSLCRVGLT
jgi:hypothetical protein